MKGCRKIRAHLRFPCTLRQRGALGGARLVLHVQPAHTHALHASCQHTYTACTRTRIPALRPAHGVHTSRSAACIVGTRRVGAPPRRTVARGHLLAWRFLHDRRQGRPRGTTGCACAHLPRAALGAGAGPHRAAHAPARRLLSARRARGQSARSTAGYNPGKRRAGTPRRPPRAYQQGNLVNTVCGNICIR